MVEAADEAMHGPEQVGVLNRLEREHNNCCEALRWCAAQGYAEPALRLAVALWWFWVVRGYASEGREWLTSLIERFPARGAMGNRSELRVRALEAAGHVASFQGDFAAARAFHQQNLPVVEEQGDASGLYRTLQNLGFVAQQQEDWEAARGYLERCLAVAREGGDQNEIANALHNLSGVLHDLGEVNQARMLLEECIPLFEQSGLPRSAAIAHLMLSIVALDQGDYDHARREAQLALAGQEQAGDSRAAVNARTTLANIALAQGDFASAERILCEGLGIMREIADPAAAAGALERFAALLAATGQAERALRLAGAAATLRESNGAQLAQRYQQQLEAELAPARTALGLAAASAAYQAGRALTLSQAIREALSFSSEDGAAAGPVAITSRQAGERRLTQRELEIAALVSQGATNRQIAQALVIAEGTAANHVLHILNKLGFGSRSQIAAWAAREGLPATPTSA
jgi:DNA-binding NarL/FixJ family response regulator